MLITHYNVKNTFLSRQSFININKKVNYIKSLLKKNCQQTKIKFSLMYYIQKNTIMGNFDVETTSSQDYGLFYKCMYYVFIIHDYFL
jgi:hypothetical protein